MSEVKFRVHFTDKHDKCSECNNFMNRKVDFTVICAEASISPVNLKVEDVPTTMEYV